MVKQAYYEVSPRITLTRYCFQEKVLKFAGVYKLHEKVRISYLPKHYGTVTRGIIDQNVFGDGR